MFSSLPRTNNIVCVTFGLSSANAFNLDMSKIYFVFFFEILITNELVYHFKGGYLHFSHLTELKIVYITQISMKKQCKSSIIKNHKITKKKKNVFDGVPLKGYVGFFF